MEMYLARQPIFDRKLAVVGYELLYRSGSDNFYAAADGDRATSELISNSLLLHGLEKLTRGRKAFINFTPALLETEVVELLPRDRVVVEVPENLDPGESLLNACKKIKRAGYLLALDDFVYDHKYGPLLELTDIVKVDFLLNRGGARQEILKRFNRPGMLYLAEKVENREDFEQASKLGYTYYQGFFFNKPVIIASRDIPSYKRTYLGILQEINKPDIDFKQVESLVKSDLSLSYKLLTFINSAAFHFQGEISSIRQALTLLGQQELVKWFSLIALKDIGKDKPEELIVTAVCRAKFCEQLAPLVGMKRRSSDFFLMGLFSLIDAFLDQPLPHILEGLPLAREIKEGLLEGTGTLGGVYKLVLAYEQNDPETASVQAVKLNLSRKEVVNSYLEALELGNLLFF